MCGYLRCRRIDYKLLEDEKIFKSAKIEYGVVVWNNGDIDIAPETMYQISYAYEEMMA